MEMLAQLASQGPQDKRADRKVRFDQTRAAYAELLEYLRLNEVELVRRSSASEYKSASRYARLITQLLEAYAPGAQSSRRDEFMADNITRILSEAPANTRMVIWAHNGHIERNEPTESWSSMGNILGHTYGDAYYALGFAFNQGSFQARSLRPDAGMALTAFTVAPSPERSFDWYLAKAGIPLFIMDFRKKPANPEIADWLSGVHRTRSIGAVFMNDDLSQISPARQFDGILFIDRTTRARPNPGVPNVAKEKSNQ
jgi:erythromycin esterase